MRAHREHVEAKADDDKAAGAEERGGGAILHSGQMELVDSKGITARYRPRLTS